MPSQLPKTPVSVKDISRRDSLSMMRGKDSYRGRKAPFPPSSLWKRPTVPPSLLPTTPTTRKPPTDRSQPDQFNDFQKNDLIKSLSDITDSVCPTGYKLEVHDGKAAIMYKLEPTVNDIQQVTETIVIDKELHVKLYKKSIPIPLPEWFRKGSDCRVRHKSSIENFAPYIKNYGDVDITNPTNMPKENQEELQNLKYEKSFNGPNFSPGMIRYAFCTTPPHRHIGCCWSSYRFLR